jgi:hypothetical protein
MLGKDFGLPSLTHGILLLTFGKSMQSELLSK